MPKPLIPDQEFVELFEKFGAAVVARKTGGAIRKVYQRRANLERRFGRQIKAPAVSPNRSRHAEPHPGRLDLHIQDGVVLVGSDAHYWPGEASTAHRALVKFCKEMKPSAVVMNGDVMDGASISRHPPINWEERPSVIQELEVCQERLGEITIAAGKARRFWPLGNHDGRFETRLATVAPEYAKVHGVHLCDHFPDWEPCWSVVINDEVWVSHRFKGGVHAAYNNTLHAGLSSVTGHLHKGVVTPFTDLRGTRYGVDLPTMANPFGPQFEYQEDNPRNHRSGFAVLTFVGAEMLQPELVLVMDAQHVQFRGKVYEV